jgi:LacI family transcriptional regulator
MQDVADAAGVHRTTVSLALRHHPSIPISTRNRIAKLAEQLAYQPNPLVRALMSQLRSQRVRNHGETIAYVTSYPPNNPWRRYPSLREMFDGARARATELGFNLEEFDLRAEGMGPFRLKKILLTRGIRGVIIAPLPERNSVLDFDVTHFAAVSLGLSLQEPPLERVASDHYQCMRRAYAECERLGYSRIGLVLGQGLSSRLEGRWLAALLYEHEVRGLTRPRPLRVTDEGQWFISQRVRKWYERETPDVIVLPLAGEDWRSLRKLPGNPGVANLSLPNATTGCAGILQDTHRIGAIGVQRVVSRLFHNDIGPLDRIQNTMLAGEWLDGESLPPKANGTIPKKPQRQATPRPGKRRPAAKSGAANLRQRSK